ncbi:MAG: KAP family NTPase [Rickettsiales bacterium]|jgi:hypothetical protein|nr:KAP family NTPase [Rickettsiales bacterium]
MIKDIANIYKLSSEELEKKIKRLWSDTAPEIKDFAENLRKLIKKYDTPYVLGLDGGYGTGKTHFATRFSKFLDKDTKTVYFSVWESDYLSDPFIAFAEQIVWLARDMKDKQSLSQKITKKLARATTIKSGFNLGIFNDVITKLTKATILKAGLNLGIVSIESEIKGEKFIKDLFPESTRIEQFQDMKDTLAEFISTLPSNKLVFIVDELDRCRPDYAVKVLETIKHFFDIDGLIVILPINSERLKIYIDGFYGINDNNTGSIAGKEDYLQKFFNEITKVPSLNYAKICEDKITLQDFAKNLSASDNRFNSISELKKWISHYASKAALSYRETLEVIKKAKIFCNSYNEEIRCHLLANKLCNQVWTNHKNRRNEFNEVLDFELDYIYDDKLGRGNSSKKVILASDRFNSIFDNLRNFHKLYKLNNIWQTIDTLLIRGSVYTFDKIYEVIQRILPAFDDLTDNDYSVSGNYYPSTNAKPIVEDLLVALNEKKQKLKQFQYIHGSDDNDDERLKDYIDKIKHPTNLFAKDK